MNPLFKYMRVISIFTGFLFGCLFVDAQENPRVGYVYPAGVQIGQSVELTVGGRGLGGMKTVLFNEAGVKAEIIEHTSNVKRKYAAYLRTIGGIYKKAPANLSESEFALLQEAARGIEEIKVGAKVAPVPMDVTFRRLPEMSLREFREVAEKFRMMESVQTNAEISEILTLRVTVDPTANAGACEMRLSGNRGLSNPMNFHVGSAVEFAEAEPNDKGQGAVYEAKAPFLLNGQVMPGDVDRFRFNAKQGQGLVLQVKARELIPYLADAVPGWFQATLRVMDPTGKELAFVDDFEYSPDPVLYFEVPADGEYTVEVRDAIYRGREDFVYRLEIGETPFVTSVFPLGAEIGEERIARLTGWNLEKSNFRMDTSGERARTKSGRARSMGYDSNSFRYALETKPVKVEGESYFSGDSFVLGETLAGLLSVKGERDSFSFEGTAGQKVKLEVRARRLGSPLDSRLLLLDEDGRQLACSDNLPPENHGLLTDHADSILEFELPDEGRYTVVLDDAQGRGGETYGYLLDTGMAEPDFELLAYPSGLKIPPRASRTIAVKAFRRSGFEGPIRISLGKESRGFKLSGAVIPEGEDHAEIVVTAGAEAGLHQLTLYGRAKVGESPISRKAMPCEPAVQAFITNHWVDTSSLLIEVGGRQPALPRFDRSSSAVDLSARKETELRLEKSKWARKTSAVFEFEIRESSKGVSIERVREEDDAYFLSLKRQGDVLSGEGWLLLDCYILRERKGAGEKARKLRRVYAGTLPAIPYHCERREDV